MRSRYHEAREVWSLGDSFHMMAGLSMNIEGVIGPKLDASRYSLFKMSMTSPQQTWTMNSQWLQWRSFSMARQTTSVAHLTFLERQQTVLESSYAAIVRALSEVRSDLLKLPATPNERKIHHWNPVGLFGVGRDAGRAFSTDERHQRVIHVKSGKLRYCDGPQTLFPAHEVICAWTFAAEQFRGQSFV